MKALLIPVLCLLSFGTWWLFFSPTAPSQPFPQPTDGTIVRLDVDEGDNQGKREAWLESMHRTAPGTSWRSIEYRNQFEKHQKMVRLRAQNSERTQDCGVESFSNDSFQAEWRERGSKNQAGSVLVTEFFPATESIYLISAGGTLWKGDLEGTTWEVVNQDLRFHDRFLKIIEGPNGPRMLATTGGIPHYSDDMGLSWLPATGVPNQDSNGNSTNGEVVVENGQTVIYLLSKPSYWVGIQLYRSTDLGLSYQSIATFTNSNFNLVKIARVKGTKALMVLDVKNDQGILYNIDNGTMVFHHVIDTFNMGRSNLQAVKLADPEDIRLYVYDSDLNLWTSDDMGFNWTKRGILPKNPWDVSLFVSEKNPDFLLFGEVECYRSTDGGYNFFKVNGWGDYYGDVAGKLHADIMYFTEVIDYQGLDFILISNHGGLSISTDELETTNNIGLSDLNVSQYYDVATDPLNPKIIYAGSQDQGFQRSNSNNETDPINFEQVISGDYGHTAFSENGKRLWTVYPGGWVTYYHQPHNSGYTASWELDSNNESVWIPPVVSGPDPDSNVVYMAGGNIYGGNGSFLIKLRYNPITNQIEREMDAYDFRVVSVGGEISYIAFSPVNPNIWYISTTNGRFFYSTDAGQNWDQNPDFLAQSHYLYGAAIYPSKVDEHTVYYGGSGYNNPGVYVSTNNGFSFIPMADGLPSTMVFELDGNEDDSRIFAATEAGPYVFNQDDQQWHDLATTCLPSQTYWSVAYLEESQIARFGTYGRGIWDLAIQESVPTRSPEPLDLKLVVFPNPSSGRLTVNIPDQLKQKASIQVFAMDGRVVLEKAIDAQAKQSDLDLSQLSKGTYEIHLRSGLKLFQQKVLIQ